MIAKLLEAVLGPQAGYVEYHSDHDKRVCEAQPAPSYEGVGELKQWNGDEWESVQ